MSVPQRRPGAPGPARPGGPPMPTGAGRPVPAAGAGPARDPFAAPSASSAEFSFDLTGVSAGYSNLPVGIWPARLDEVANGVANSGNKKVVWTFTIAAGPQRGKQGQLHCAITQKAMFKIAQTVEALGIAQTGGPVRFTKEDAVGRYCAIVVSEREGTDGVIRPSLESAQPFYTYHTESDFQEAMQLHGLDETGTPV